MQGEYTETPILDKGVKLRGATVGSKPILLNGVTIGNPTRVITGPALDNLEIHGVATGRYQVYFDRDAVEIRDFQMVDCVLDGDTEVRIAVYLRQTSGTLSLTDNEIRFFNHWAVLEMSGSSHYHPFPYSSIRFQRNWLHVRCCTPCPVAPQLAVADTHFPARA